MQIGVIMMIVAKFKDKIVQIVKVQESVMFSEDKGWIFICFDFDKINRKREQFKWVRASETRFEWVREFVGE
jgi:hypothetical protein